jgi:hypothetical protein
MECLEFGCCGAELLLARRTGLRRFCREAENL